MINRQKGKGIQLEGCPTLWIPCNQASGTLNITETWSRTKSYSGSHETRKVFDNGELSAQTGQCKGWTNTDSGQNEQKSTSKKYFQHN